MQSGIRSKNIVDAAVAVPVFQYRLFGVFHRFPSHSFVEGRTLLDALAVTDHTAIRIHSTNHYHTYTMGLFGGKKSSQGNAPGGVYIDMDGQPIPVAVAMSPPTSRPCSPQPTAPTATPIMYLPFSAQPEQPKSSGFMGKARVAPAPSSATLLPPLFLSRFPTVVKQCPVCHQRNARTRIVTAPDFVTWVAVAVLLVVCWPLCWIPLVSDAGRRTTHYCTTCDAPLGSIRPFHDCCVKRR
jgi:LITAF-like zinc ribbon domain